MMNPKLLKSLLSCLLITVSMTVLKAQEVEKKANFTNFNGVSVSSSIDLYLTQSNSEQIVVKGTKDLMDKLKISKDADGLLKFEMDKGNGWGNWSWGKDSYVKAYVSFKTLSRLIASGGSDVYSQGQLKLNDLAIRSSGGSDLKLDLIVGDLRVVSSGGSDVYLKGKASSFSLLGAGGSDVKAFNLIADKVDVQMSGGSDGELYAVKSLTIIASGASDVDYKGTPTKKVIKSTGASDVKKVSF
ncbi:MAG: head GIN domain-containing protein [Pelobium sp.]